ncbi:hypothetical protein BOTBODRAFT_544030 [Botryobasidium botryosum FD-172 SS1]|uniref:SET domain-containing protein n=1 Tax=Botryobasidium botryosum (strain FD-172 SS1) TaxID=930990 RepID=A0A067MQT5_BOTB1|nr:hypothetical protein BOTBODRAFT_544030 [Botryobasidium botryosum FD-172 SS1]
MNVRKTHLRRYLLCAIVVPPARVVATTLCVEDPEGSTFQVSVFNYPGTALAPGKVLDTIFPNGSILAIREPTVIAGPDPREALVRVDSPSDIIFVRPTDEILRGVKWKYVMHASGPAFRPAAKWREVAELHYKERYYYAAAVAHTHAWELDSSRAQSLFLRGMAYFRGGYYSAALADAKALLELRAEQDTDLYLLGQCQYALGDYEAARSVFERVITRDAAIRSSASGYAKLCERRIEESRFGVYPWGITFKESLAPNFDIAEYVGPMKVISMPHRGGGRGVVTTRAVKAGELILVAKPVVYAFPSEREGHRYSHGLNFITKSPESPCASDAMWELVGKAACHPELVPLLNGLYAGPSYPPPPLEYPPSVSGGTKTRHPRIHEVDIDPEKLQNIYTYNAFIPRPISPMDSPDPSLDDPNNLPSALYLLPSLFNHACAGTASWQTFRHIMVIRALKNLDEGEELTLAYVTGRTAWDRQAALRNYGFECDCFLCMMDRKDGMRGCAIRNDLGGRGMLEAILPALRTGVAAARKRLCEIEGTYDPTRGLIRPASSIARQELALLYATQAEKDRLPDSIYWIQSIRIKMEALEALGMAVLDKSVSGPVKPELLDMVPLDLLSLKLLSAERDRYIELILSIASNFHSMGDFYRTTIWIRTSSWVHEIYTGGGTELYKLRHHEHLKKLNLYNFIVTGT